MGVVLVISIEDRRQWRRTVAGQRRTAARIGILGLAVVAASLAT
jgi:hypothetical protein